MTDMKKTFFLWLALGATTTGTDEKQRRIYHL